PELRQGEAGVPKQDLAVARRHHPPGVAIEELHLERAFHLAQKLGGGRLRETGGGSGARETALVAQMDEQYELADLQVMAGRGCLVARNHRQFFRLVTRAAPHVEYTSIHRLPPLETAVVGRWERRSGCYCNCGGLKR